MTQEEKDLLLIDLCARLPYKTRVRYIYAFAGIACISEYSDEGTLYYDKLQEFSLTNIEYEKRRVVHILPYLRPMSSMTKEEKSEYDKICGFYGIHECEHVIDWLNKNMFDYRGLIPMGLALEALKGMYQVN